MEKKIKGTRISGRKDIKEDKNKKQRRFRKDISDMTGIRNRK